jgi:hypothetical protein
MGKTTERPLAAKLGELRIAPEYKPARALVVIPPRGRGVPPPQTDPMPATARTDPAYKAPAPARPDFSRLDAAELLRIAREHHLAYGAAPKANAVVAAARAALREPPATRSADQVQAAMPVPKPKPNRVKGECPIRQWCISVGLPLSGCVYR